ncbi:hypothetical protein [Methanosalsum natronophilum]|uniref:Uncharacterized protein n=1 Tax=Methanosalsum natronophilum TaxID=768733 RepID=A0A424YY55_9EURY|nr:hypothetical protein [Methanosalsum natronophilum]MCS3924178.1 hypothetical protein [Methanosalsum natronophilum]RQD85619.1 MAG: hypothetical protein D5R95_04440 [Methanosalsum natronophilum]
MSWWKDKLEKIIVSSSKSESDRYPDDLNVKFAHLKLRKTFKNIVIPAIDELKKEIELYNRRVIVNVDDTGLNSVTLFVYSCSEENTNKYIEEFCLSIIGRTYQKAFFAFPEHGNSEEPRIVKIEILSRSGTLAEFNVDEVTQEQIIETFIEEYSKWINY